jgi:hypothetical protein
MDFIILTFVLYATDPSTAKYLSGLKKQTSQAPVTQYNYPVEIASQLLPTLSPSAANLAMPIQHCLVI